MAGKEAVMGFLERGGKVRTRHIRGTKRTSLLPHVFDNVHPESYIFSDSHPSYLRLEAAFRHHFVDHAVTYCEGRIHTNGLENFWSLLKRTIRGTYVSVKPFHLFRYLDQQAFLYNERRGKNADRFELVVSGAKGKRLTYTTLTGKTSQP